MALSSSELRIGNYLHSNLSKCVFQVLVEDILNIDYDPAVAKPIPLTEQWLKDFGFKEVKGNAWAIMYRELEVFQIWCRDKKYFRYTPNEWMHVKLESVHKLQNLYFALTGKELTK